MKSVVERRELIVWDPPTADLILVTFGVTASEREVLGDDFEDDSLEDISFTDVSAGGASGPTLDNASREVTEIATELRVEKD